MYDTCIALVVISVQNAVSDEGLSESKTLKPLSHSSELKSDEFQRCSEVEMFFPSRKWKRSAEVRGALVEWKVKDAKLKGPEEL